jgi:hypothetical protein
MNLQQFSSFLSDNSEKIDQVGNEVAEIQAGFNAAFVESSAQQAAALQRAAEAMVASLEQSGEEIHQGVLDRLEAERTRLEQRRQELSSTLIPEAQQAADHSHAAALALRRNLEQLNPELNSKEEKLKAERQDYEHRLATVNQQIKQLSRGFGVVINFSKITNADRNRQQIILRLGSLQKDLLEVRKKWQDIFDVSTAEETRLKEDWQAKTLQLAQFQAEQAYLDDPANRENLAAIHAARLVLEGLEELPDIPQAEVKEQVEQFLQAKERLQAYQDGLVTINGFIGLLKGIADGLRRFNTSVQGLIEEQNMHASYLPALDIDLPGSVSSYHRQWDGLRSKVLDEVALAADPDSFVAIVQPVLDDPLSDRNVTAMFEAMGQALERSTQAWKG